MDNKMQEIIRARKEKTNNNFTYQDKSKERLWNIVETKCKTIMIGSLAQFEKRFGELWGHSKSNLTEKQELMKKLWLECREDVLNKGNANIRAIKKELDEYMVSWKRKNYVADANDEEKK